MGNFTKKDLKFSIATGLITGTIVWRVFGFLDLHSFYDVSFVWLIVLVPIAWIAGVNLGYFLGRWMAFFNQFGRYSAVGFTNAAVDFGVLNLLISLSGYNSGWYYTLFKTCSFAVAVSSSYFWNRFWVFGSNDSDNHGVEFVKFLSVNILAALVNITVASLIVNFVSPFAGLDAKTWANAGAVAGSAVALIFNFLGFKFAVFKK